MQINEFLFLLIAFLVGLVLGWFFFYGLRVTVDNLPKVKHPAILILSSYLVRTVVVVAAFYLVMDGSIFRLLASLVGFILARTILIKRVQQQSQH